MATLTAVRQPIEEIGSAAIALVLDPKSTATYRSFDTTLIIRGSCGCHPA